MAGCYKNILFDLDGTLTDSAEGVTKSVQHSLQQFGIVRAPEELKLFIGPPLQLSFQNYYGLSESKALQAVNYYRDYYRQKGIFENRLYPSVTEMLEKLTAKGTQVFVATSKPTVFAKIVLQHFGIEHFFKFIAGSNLDGTRIEKSDVIKYVLGLIRNPDRTKTIMVGDRKHDIKGARICGIDSVAVTYGYGSSAELIAAKPTFMVHSIPELTNLLLV